MKKILIVDIGQLNGGIEKYILNVYKYVNKLNIHFDFLVYNERCAYEDIFSANGNVYHITGRRIKPIKYYCQLKKFFKSSDYDAVWIQTCSASNITAHKFVKKYTSARLITHAHVTKAETKGVIHAIVTNILHLCHRAKLRKITDVALACSKEAGFYLFGKKRNLNIRVVYNGIDISQYRLYQKERNAIREEYNFKANDIIVGHVGRFSLIKNHQFLIDIFNEFYKNEKRAKLILIGEGPEKKNIEDKVQELGLNNQVLFLGARKDVPRLLCMLDAFVFPSYNEGFGIAVIEAQAANLPTVINENLSKTLDVSNFIYRISLQAKPVEWAMMIEKVIKLKDHKYYGNFEEYDIKSTAKIIENILLGD